MNERLAIGGNNPPSQIEFVIETISDLRKWLVDCPAIQTEEDARSAKLMRDRASDALKDMEAERKGLVDPINAQIKEINDRYRAPKSDLQTAADLLDGRLSAYVLAEESKRKAEAERIRLEAEEAARLAKEAMVVAAESKANAAAGEVLDVVGDAQRAKQAIADAQRLERQAARAERDQKVRIGGGFRRALAARNKEILVVKDVHAAIEALGLTVNICEAILGSARHYRHAFGELPDGVEAIIEREI